ncbi:MAG: hypothetical protein F4Y26_00480 [Gammaproteobacteria bacterium]|nr:hypothetical protein [Gammaproteobacteria bacterium]
MAKGKPGYKISIKIANASGVMTDVTPWANQVALNEVKEQIESSVLQFDKEFTSGQHSWVVPFSGLWHPTPDAVFAGLMGENTDERNIEIGWEGTGAGKVKYTGLANLGQYDRTGGGSSVNTFSATAQGTGPLTLGSFS